MSYDMTSHLNLVRTMDAESRANSQTRRALRLRDTAIEYGLKAQRLEAEVKQWKAALERYQGAFADRDKPDHDFVHLSRVEELSGALKGDLTKLTIAQRRERVVDAIVWTEYILFTEFHLYKLLEQQYAPFMKKIKAARKGESEKTVGQLKQEYFENSGNALLSLHEGFIAVERAKKDPQAWVANRKKAVTKMIRFKGNHDVEPIIESLDSVTSTIKENVLEYGEVKEGRRVGMFRMQFNVVRKLM